MMYAPFAVPSALAQLLRSRTGKFCRESAKPTGLPRFITSRQAIAVSLASAGLTTAKFGISRSDAMCSTG